MIKRREKALKNKYVTFFVGKGIKFKNKNYLSKTELIPAPRRSHVHFHGAGIVLDLEQVKMMEINGIRYTMQEYQV